jgi:MYXO-CTERM domain-containing protein
MSEPLRHRRVADRLWMLVLPLLVQQSVAAHAFVRGKTPAPHNKPLFWKATSVPFVLDAAGSDDLPFDTVAPIVRRALARWSDQGCSYLELRDEGVRPGLGVAYTRGGANVNAVVWLERNWIGARSATAYTTITYVPDTGQMLDADIAMNGVDFRFSAQDIGVRDRIDVEAVVTHEAGHFVGLDHSAVPGATMGPAINFGDIFQRDLADDDREGLCAVYALGTEPPVTPPGGGCHTGGGHAGGVGAMAMLLLVALRWRRRMRPTTRCS